MRKFDGRDDGNENQMWISGLWKNDGKNGKFIPEGRKKEDIAIDEEEK